jgi:sugar/nucleoside kinase (ribokinase family)
MLTPPDILCLGEASARLCATDPDRRSYRLDPAGDALLTALAAARSGGRVGLLAAAPDGVTGDALLALCRANAVDDSAVKRENGELERSGGPDGAAGAFTIDSVAPLQPSDLPLALLRRVRVLHVASSFQARCHHRCDTALEAMRIARSVGVAVAYRAEADRAGWPLERARAIALASLRGADIALVSREDGARLTGFSDCDAICDYQLANGARMVLLELGPGETLVATSLSRQRITLRAEPVKDATLRHAAHDGAFLAEWVRAEDPFEAARYALTALRLVREGRDIIEALPSKAAVMAHRARRDRDESVAGTDL